MVAFFQHSGFMHNEKHAAELYTSVVLGGAFFVVVEYFQLDARVAGGTIPQQLQSYSFVFSLDVDVLQFYCLFELVKPLLCLLVDSLGAAADLHSGTLKLIRKSNRLSVLVDLFD